MPTRRKSNTVHRRLCQACTHNLTKSEGGLNKVQIERKYSFPRGISTRKQEIASLKRRGQCKKACAKGRKRTTRKRSSKGRKRSSKGRKRSTRK